MKIRIGVTKGLGGDMCGTVTLQREPGDPKARGGGWSAHHGWGPLHQLLHWLKERLNAAGFNLAKKRMSADGHMFGDDETPYLCARNNVRRHPHVYIYDGQYACRDAADEFNAGEEVTLLIAGNVYAEVDQDNWWQIVRDLCREDGIPVTVSR